MPFEILKDFPEEYYIIASSSRLIESYIYLIAYFTIMRRGRPKCPRRVEMIPHATYFKPRGIPFENLEVIELSIVELEALRLVDLLGLDQDTASAKMGISRRAFWNELTNARIKVAKALVNGYAIKIKGGEYIMEKRRFICTECMHDWSMPLGGGRPEKCPKCGSINFHRHPESRGPHGPRCMHGYGHGPGFGRCGCYRTSRKDMNKMQKEQNNEEE